MSWEHVGHSLGTIATWVGFFVAMVTIYLVRNGRRPLLAGIRHTALAICVTEILLWGMDVLYWTQVLPLAEYSLWRRAVGRPLLAWIAVAFLLWLFRRPIPPPQ